VEFDEPEVKPEKKKKAKKEPKIKILFVCSGNTCRSAMAESIFKNEIKKKKLTAKFDVSSCGLTANEGDGISPSSRAALAYLDIPWHKHKAKKFKSEMTEKVDLVVCMTREHKSRLTATNAYTVGEITGRGDVPDPYGYPVEAYIKVAKYLCECVEPVLDAAGYLREKKNEKK
jgi:protein-tyrosine-phosphatase